MTIWLAGIQGSTLTVECKDQERCEGDQPMGLSAASVCTVCLIKRKTSMKSVCWNLIQMASVHTVVTKHLTIFLEPFYWCSLFLPSSTSSPTRKHALPQKGWMYAQSTGIIFLVFCIWKKIWNESGISNFISEKPTYQDALCHIPKDIKLNFCYQITLYWLCSCILF